MTTVRPPSSVPASASAEELARRARAGSRACFDALVDRFAPRLLSFLIRRVGSRQDAEDLTQETFVRAWRRLETYNPDRRFSTWLFTIGVRLSAAYLRARRRMQALAADPGDRRAAAGDAAAERDEGALLWRLAEDELTPDQFSALWLRYVEGASVEDIARMLGKSRVGARVLLFRARSRLGDRLGEPEGSAGRRAGPAVTVRPRRERVGGAA